MSESLYKLSERYQSAYLVLADADLPEEAITDTLEALEGEVEEKSINVAYMIENWKAQAEQIDLAIKAMTARKKALLNKSENLKDYLQSNMERTGITSINCPYFDINMRKNPPSVEIEDESLIPNKFKEEKVTISISKTAIKKAIQAGEDCPGAKLNQAMRVQIK